MTRPAPTYLYVRRPRCICGSVKLKSYATRRNGDGSLTRYTRCRACGRRLILVVE